MQQRLTSEILLPVNRSSGLRQARESTSLKLEKKKNEEFWIKNSLFARQTSTKNGTKAPMLSPRSPLAECVSFPSSDAPDLTLEGRLALRRGQRRISEVEGAAVASTTTRRIDDSSGGVASASTLSQPLPSPPPPPPPPPAADLALVLLHPHAALGGSMTDPICTAIYREAKRHPRFGAVARYNARGAGGGSGSGGGGSLSGQGRLLLSSLWRSRQGAEDAAAVIRAVSTGEGIEIDGETTFGDDDEDDDDEEGDEGGAGADRSARSGDCSSSAAPTAATATPTAKAEHFSRGRRRLRRRRKGYPDIARTFVVGYSWGSCVGAAAVSSLVAKPSPSSPPSSSGGKEEEARATRIEIGGLVAVSPPLGAAASLALGSGKCFASLSLVPSLPVLVTMGDCDQFCGERAARNAVEGVNRARMEKVAGSSPSPCSPASPSAAAAAFKPLRLEVSRGLDHFWGAEDDPWSREEIGRLAERVVAWILEQ